MKKLLSVFAIIGLTAMSYGQSVELPSPIKWEVSINQITKPVPVLNAANRWQSTVGYDVRNQVVYDEVGSLNKIKRLMGEMTLEISKQEIFYLRQLSDQDTYGPGEWEAHVLQAGFMKAAILSVDNETRSQYETYWNQVVYNPVPVVPIIQDANGADIVGWEGLVPVIAYTDEDQDPETPDVPTYGVLPKDGQGNDIFGTWGGQSVVGYDSFGFPLFAQ